MVFFFDKIVDVEGVILIHNLRALLHSFDPVEDYNLIPWDLVPGENFIDWTK